MQIIKFADPSAIPTAIEALKRGELVIYPTETCYGLAADAANKAAVTKLLAYKGDRHRQVSIAVTDRDMAIKFVKLNEIADNLYKNLLPGPVTVISHSRHLVDERLESAEGTLGIRVPDHAFALTLIRAFGKPITATSANTSGKKEPYSLADWQKYTISSKQDVVSLFLDAGKLAERPTSTVVDTTLNEPAILRQGELLIPSLPGQSFSSESPQETHQIGATILNKHLNLLHKFPLLIALQGDLGAGKTQLAKGFALELGIDQNVPSPTYTLMREYPFTTSKYSGTLYHIDTWRLTDMSELDSTLGLSKILKPGNIVIMEWAGKAKSFLDAHHEDTAILLIDISEINPSTRQISYSLSTPEWT